MSRKRLDLGIPPLVFWSGHYSLAYHYVFSILLTCLESHSHKNEFAVFDFSCLRFFNLDIESMDSLDFMQELFTE